jgi:aspartate/methionine/tyrosine aminotransferase
VPKLASGSTAHGSRLVRHSRLIDLADGYAELDPIVELRADLFSHLKSTPRRRLEAEFLARYQRVSGESVDVNDVVFFLTASQAIGVVAKHLAAGGVRRIGIPEPTFDNLPRLLVAAGLEPVPVAENDEALLDAAGSLDAIFLVLPNNPTGWTPSRRALAALPAAARRSGCLVVIDRTCRFLQEEQYPEILGAGFEWIDIEDTGKTWTTGGTKVAFVRAKSSLTLDAIWEGLDMHMKCVPALNLHIAAEVIAREDGAERIRRAIGLNREVLVNTLGPLGFELASRPLGVALLRLPQDCALGSTHLAEKVLTEGVEIMAGGRFFWHSPKAGEPFIRVSLARPTESFPHKIRALAKAIKAFT